MNTAQDALEEEMQREIPGYTPITGAFPIISIRQSSPFLVCVRQGSVFPDLPMYIISAYLKLGGRVVKQEHAHIRFLPNTHPELVKLRIERTCESFIDSFKRQLCREMESLIGDLRIEAPEKQ